MSAGPTASYRYSLYSRLKGQSTVLEKVADLQRRFAPSETGTKNVEVNIDTLDNCFKEYNLPKPDFIKIDIEGLEYDALIGMNEIIKNWKPSLYIEIHGADYQCKLTNINRIVNYLYKRSYNIYHIESGKVISRKNVSAALEGHIYCTSK